MSGLYPDHTGGLTFGGQQFHNPAKRPAGNRCIGCNRQKDKAARPGLCAGCRDSRDMEARWAREDAAEAAQEGADT